MYVKCALWLKVGHPPVFTPFCASAAADVYKGQVISIVVVPPPLGAFFGAAFVGVTTD